MKKRIALTLLAIALSTISIQTFQLQNKTGKPITIVFEHRVSLKTKKKIYTARKNLIDGKTTLKKPLKKMAGGKPADILQAIIVYDEKIQIPESSFDTKPSGGIRIPLPEMPTSDAPYRLYLEKGKFILYGTPKDHQPYNPTQIAYFKVIKDPKKIGSTIFDLEQSTVVSKKKKTDSD